MKKIRDGLFLLAVFAMSVIVGIVCANVLSKECKNPYQLTKQESEPIPALDFKGPDFCEIGELVRFDLRGSTVQGITWRIIPETEDFEVIEDGRRAFFSSRGPGEFLLIVAGAFDGQPLLEYHRLVVEGDTKVDSGKSDIGRKVRGWLAKVEEYEGRTAHCIAVAAVFRELATRDDVLVDNMLEATALANSAVLGDDLEKWVPFLDALGHELDKYSEDGGLSTRDDYRAIWLAIAKAIEK